MMNWTDEAVRAEADYRRHQLHRMVSQRRTAERKGNGIWHRWLPRGQRH